MAESHLCITPGASQLIKLDSEVAFGHDKSDKVGRRIFIRWGDCNPLADEVNRKIHLEKSPVPQTHSFVSLPSF